MTNKKSLKRAFILNVLSTLLCISMLLGTTFAWFTDTVESGINTIVAGNLDVELTRKLADGSFESVQDQDDLFAIEKWEPGAYAFEVFKVENVGDLALKYQLSAILNTTDSTLPDGYNTVVDPNGTDTGKSLLDVLCVKEIAGDADLTSRPAYTDGVLLGEYLEGGSVKSAALEPGASTTTTIVIYWPESEADNGWNLQNGKYASDANAETVGNLKVKFAVRLVATQYTSESDSFDNQYDAGSNDDIIATSATATTSVAATGETIIVVNEVGDIGSTTVTIPEDVLPANTEVVLVVEESDDSNITFSTTASETTCFDVDLVDKATGESVATDGTKLIKVEVDIGANLVLSQVKHKDAIMTEGTGTAADQYSYNAENGILSMWVKDFSPFGVNYDKAVAKVGGIYFASLKEAVAIGGTVDVICDNSVDQNIPVTADTTLNLNGYTITNNVADNRMFRVSGITFTINGDNGTIITPDDFIKSYGFVDMRDAFNTASADAKLIINDTTFYGTTCAGSLFKYRTNGQSMEFNNVDVTVPYGSNTNYDGYAHGDTYSIVNGYQLTVELKVVGGTYIYNSRNTSAGVFQVGTFDTSKYEETDESKAYVADGVKVIANYGPIMEAHGTVAFRDCDFSFESSRTNYLESAIAAANGGVATVDGGTYSGTYGAYVWSSGGKIIINDGTFTGTSAAVYAQTDTTSYPNATALIEINGGTFNGTLETSGNSSIVIRGGTFSADPTEYVAAGYVATESEGIWTVTAE